MSRPLSLRHTYPSSIRTRQLGSRFMDVGQRRPAGYQGSDKIAARVAWHNTGVTASCERERLLPPVATAFLFASHSRWNPSESMCADSCFAFGGRERNVWRPAVHSSAGCCRASTSVAAKPHVRRKGVTGFTPGCQTTKRHEITAECARAAARRHVHGRLAVAGPAPRLTPARPRSPKAGAARVSHCAGACLCPSEGASARRQRECIPLFAPSSVWTQPSMQ
jgi:hypothetical protein